MTVEVVPGHAAALGIIAQLKALVEDREQLRAKLAPGSGHKSDGPDARLAAVKRIIKHRIVRDEIMGADVFADPSWDMLLDLYLAHYTNKRVSVSSLCIASRVPPTTALRWIGALEEKSLLARERDKADGRRVHVVLTEDGLTKLERWFDRILAQD